MRTKIFTCLFVLISGSLAFTLTNCRGCDNPCLHGEQQEAPDCNCKCEPGWKGPQCDVPDNQSFVSADITYPNPFLFKTDKISLKSKQSSGLDTLTIEAEMIGGEWLSIVLLVKDLSVLKKDSFPITQGGFENEARINHENSSITLDNFSPKVPGYGFFYVDTFDMAKGVLKGRFYTALTTGNGNTCGIHNGMIDRR